jgi:hypothetical protein
MMATQELVVPKSIPITSPASAEEDCHLRARKGDEYEGDAAEAAEAADRDGTWCV